MWNGVFEKFELAMSCSSLTQQLKLKVRISEERITKCSKVDRKFAICPITTNSSKIVLVPIKNSNNSYESTIADQKNTLIGNVDIWTNQTFQIIDFFELKLIIIINFLDLS